MKQKYDGSHGKSIKLFEQIISSKVKERIPKPAKKGREIRTKRSGILESNDMKNFNTGIFALSKGVENFFEIMTHGLLSGKSDVSKTKMRVFEYRTIIYDLLEKLYNNSKNEQILYQKIKSLQTKQQVAQAAEHGVLMKKLEISDREGNEVVRNIPISPESAIDTLDRYEKIYNDIQKEKISCLMSIGIAIHCIAGEICDNSENRQGKIRNITMGSLVVSGVKLVSQITNKEEWRKERNLERKVKQKISDFYKTTPLSTRVTEKEIEAIISAILEEEEHANTITDTKFKSNLIIDLATCILVGDYFSKNVKKTKDGQYEAESTAEVLSDIFMQKDIAKELVNVILTLPKLINDMREASEVSEEARSIIKQMEEKVYSLEGAKGSFNTLRIKNFEGRFHLDDENGDFHKVSIPEFSMRKWDGHTDIVLLSGERGTGKSSLTDLLRAGDINNRKCIELDNGEKVDHIGNESVYLGYSINRIEGSILEYITGKYNISDLDDNEMQKLISILKDLEFDKNKKPNSSNIIARIENDDVLRFSLGEQRCLEFARFLYKEDKEASIILADEPFGNVDDSLMRKQFEMLIEYAKKHNQMLLLITHRVDLVKDLVDKWYEINQDGVLKEMPLIDERIDTEKEKALNKMENLDRE